MLEMLIIPDILCQTTAYSVRISPSGEQFYQNANPFLAMH